MITEEEGQRVQWVSITEIKIREHFWIKGVRYQNSGFLGVKYRATSANGVVYLDPSQTVEKCYG